VGRIAQTRLPELGSGMIFIPGLEPVIEACNEWIDVIEIEPQTFWSGLSVQSAQQRANPEIRHWIRQLSKPLLLHGVGNPLACSLSIHDVQTAAFREAVAEFNPPWVSEHLSFNRVATDQEPFWTGFFLPPLQTSPVAAYCAKNVKQFQNEVGVPVLFETGVNYLQRQDEEISDGNFVRAVAERADCGILMDLHNMWTNERCGRDAVLDVVSEIPADRVLEIHLAGGEQVNGWWLDAHSGLVPEPLQKITEQVVARLPNLKAIIFEIMPQHIRANKLDMRKIADHLQWIHEVWRTRGSRVKATSNLGSPKSFTQSFKESSLSGSDWENALGRLAIGRIATSALERKLALDQGVRVFADLIISIRGGGLQDTLPLTCVYLKLSLGEAQFRKLVAEFCRRYPPTVFPSEDAKHFTEYLHHEKMAIPHLLQVAHFELAVIEIQSSDLSVSVQFTCDPEPLLACLAAGDLPNPMVLEDHEITIIHDREAGTSLHVRSVTKGCSTESC